MATARRQPLADRAAALLLERVRAGEWRLGQKLPGEATLAAQTGVGRSTMREAVRQLVGRGVLSTRQGAGVFLEALDVPAEWDEVLRRADLRAVVEARIAIEVEAAALAAARRSPTRLRAIRRSLAARGEPWDDVEAHVDADTRFHRAIVLAADNPILTELFDGFTPRNRAATIDLLRLGAEGDAGDDQRVHEGIADAIAARDPALAADRTRTHLLGLRDRLG